MSQLDVSSDKREFHCNHCSGQIQIPWNLPPTTGPCPHCGGVITSPGPVNTPPPTPVFDLPAYLSKPRPDAGSVPSVRVENDVSQNAAESETLASTIPPRGDADGLPAEKTGAETSLPKQGKPPDGGGRNKGDKSGLIPVMLVLLVLILIGGAVVIYASSEMGRNISPPSTVRLPGSAAASEDYYLRIGWQKEAYQVLRGYLAGKTVEEKLPYILHPESLAERMEDFYGGGEIIDTDTPADSFSPYELSMEDRKRGLFLMIYDQPTQFDIKEFFRPLASAEVQAGLDDAGLLLSSVAKMNNFTMAPLRGHAYFKRTPEGLKLDWEVFAQTKYSTFQTFVELPEIGLTGVFRVFVTEDVPDKRRVEQGCRTYRVFDTASPSVSTRINVKVDSDVGRTLSVLNWREIQDARPSTRTATVELQWMGDETSPQLKIKRFICWEFLGLGGEDGDAVSSK